jgi:hypothetical protein
LLTLSTCPMMNETPMCSSSFSTPPSTMGTRNSYVCAVRAVCAVCAVCAVVLVVVSRAAERIGGSVQARRVAP